MPVIRNIREQKLGLRKKYRSLRQKLSTDKKQKFDSEIADRFLSLTEYKNCDTLLAYISKDIEVGTEKIVKSALSQGKTVAVPRCNTNDCTMDFYQIKSYDDLQKGAYGLLEPDVSRCKKLTDFENSVCIVPGLAFDCEGYRLGFGKGYYDRFLQRFSGVKVGICYKECVTWQLPHGRFDKAVDIVLTQRYIRNINK